MKAKNERIVRVLQQRIRARGQLPEVPERVTEMGKKLGLGDFARRHLLPHAEVFEFAGGFLRFTRDSDFDETPDLLFKKPKLGSEWLDPTTSVSSRVVEIAERRHLGAYKSTTVVDPDEPRVIYEFASGNVEREGNTVREAPLRPFDRAWLPKVDHRSPNKYANGTPIAASARRPLGRMLRVGQRVGVIGEDGAGTITAVVRTYSPKYPRGHATVRLEGRTMNLPFEMLSANDP